MRRRSNTGCMPSCCLSKEELDVDVEVLFPSQMLLISDGVLGD